MSNQRANDMSNEGYYLLLQCTVPEPKESFHIQLEL